MAKAKIKIHVPAKEPQFCTINGVQHVWHEDSDNKGGIWVPLQINKATVAEPVQFKNDIVPHDGRSYTPAFTKAHAARCVRNN